MTTLIAHLSDLHCPADDPAQEEMLVEAVNMARPDMVIVSGDLTHAGRKREFASARALLSRINAPKLVVPGNHDVPVFNAVERIGSPFARFRRAFPEDEAIVAIGGVLAAGLNTATNMQPSLDWSLGWAMPHRVDRTVAALKSDGQATFRIVACHHPLLAEDADLQRSRTKNGPMAFHILAKAGMDMLLHGHLHRQKARTVACEGREVIVIGAGTALGDRERGEPSGFNFISIKNCTATVSAMRWNGTTFLPGDELVG